LTAKQESFLARVVEDLGGRGFLPATVSELAQSLVVPPQAVQAILELGVSTAAVVNLGAGLYASSAQIEFLLNQVAERGNSTGFDAAFFRGTTLLSRRLAESWLRYLEEHGQLVKRDGKWWIGERRSPAQSKIV
jgi:hypothetical protein